MALVSAVILSLVLLGAVAGMSMRSVYARQDALDAAMRAQADEAARGCISMVRLALAADRNYAGNAAVATGDSSCFIGGITQSHAAYRFTIRCADGSAAVQLSAVLSARDLSLVQTEGIQGIPP